MSISMGAFIGVLPLFGISTAIITALALYLRLNLPIAVFVTYAVSPIHVLLFIPFIRIGEWVFNVEHSLLTLTAIKEAFKADYVQAISDLAFQIGCGITGWAFAGIPIAILFFFVLCKFIPLFKNKNRPLSQ